MCYLLKLNNRDQQMPVKYSAKLPRDFEGRQLLKEALAGYGRANEHIENELRQKLPKISEEAARQEFEELYAVWQHTRKYHPDPAGEAILDQLHIQSLVERRRMWDKIARQLLKRKPAYAANL